MCTSFACRQTTEWESEFVDGVYGYAQSLACRGIFRMSWGVVTHSHDQLTPYAAMPTHHRHPPVPIHLHRTSPVLSITNSIQHPPHNRPVTARREDPVPCTVSDTRSRSHHAVQAGHQGHCLGVLVSGQSVAAYCTYASRSSWYCASCV